MIRLPTVAVRLDPSESREPPFTPLSNRRMRRWAFVVVSLTLAGLLWPSSAHGELKFNFITTPGMDAQAVQGFTEAGKRWSALFNDDVTVNISINFTALGAGILGQASSADTSISYASARAALVNDAISVDDATSSKALQAGSSMAMLINRTRDNPNGRGSSTPYFDNNGGANNTTINMTTANAKALGVYTGSSSAVDATISFSSSYAWDFNPGKGFITAGQYDFVGVATHEIGHALGFTSGVDVLDSLGGRRYNADLFTNVSTMDLFRFSSRSIDTTAGGGTGVIDWTADTADKYFSVDGGITPLALFSTGVNRGDGQQASHWKDSQSIGIMDPTAATGELLGISARDAQLLDVIGWNPVAVPEPGSLALAVVSVGMAVGLCRRRQRAPD